jgi:hypothetical protein
MTYFIKILLIRALITSAIVWVVLATNKCNAQEIKKIHYDNALEVNNDVELVRYIKDSCKSEKNPLRCMSSAIAIMKHETQNCTIWSANINNCFWLRDRYWFMQFKTKQASFERWLISYQRYWYTNKTWKDWVYRSYYTTTQKEAWINNFMYYKLKIICNY